MASSLGQLLFGLERCVKTLRSLSVRSQAACQHLVRFIVRALERICNYARCPLWVESGRSPMSANGHRLLTSWGRTVCDAVSIGSAFHHPEPLSNERSFTLDSYGFLHIPVCLRCSRLGPF